MRKAKKTSTPRVRKCRNFQQTAKNFHTIQVYESGQRKHVIKESENNTMYDTSSGSQQSSPVSPRDDENMFDNFGGGDIFSCFDESSEGDEPLYEGSNISVSSTLSLLLFILVSYSIPISKVDKFLSIIYLLLPKDNKLPTTKAKLFKEFSNYGNMQKVHYCDTCDKVLNSQEECDHRNDHKFFLYHSLSEQVQERVKQDDEFGKSFNYHKTIKSDKNIRDVYDGAYFKEASAMFNGNGLFFQIIGMVLAHSSLPSTQFGQYMPQF